MITINRLKKIQQLLEGKKEYFYSYPDKTIRQYFSYVSLMLNGDIPFKSVLIDDFCRERNIKKVTIKRNIKKVSSDEYDKQLKLIIKRAKELENNG